MFSQAALIRLSNRIFCGLLYLYPARFRREYGYDMAQVFRDDVRGTYHESGVWAVTGLWMLAFVDLVKTAVAEHLMEIFHMPLENLTRWSGPAGAMGGILYAIGSASIVYGVTAFIFSAIGAGLLLGFGLFGLYKCLPPTFGRLNTLTFCAALFGLLMSHFSAVAIVWTDNSESLWITALFMGLSIIGFAGMGIIAMANQSLGRLSFTPLLALVATLSLFSLYNNQTFSSLWVIVLSFYAGSWILLGIALWQAYREPEPPEPGVFA